MADNATTDDDHDRIIRLEGHVAAHEALVAEQLLARDKALEKVAERASAVQEQQNEWRATVNDVAGGKLGREEFARQHDALVSRVNALEQRLASATGTAQGRLTVVAMLAVAVSILSLIVLIVTHVGS